MKEVRTMMLGGGLFMVFGILTMLAVIILPIVLVVGLGAALVAKK